MVGFFVFLLALVSWTFAYGYWLGGAPEGFVYAIFFGILLKHGYLLVIGIAIAEKISYQSVGKLFQPLLYLALVAAMCTVILALDGFFEGSTNIADKFDRGWLYKFGLPVFFPAFIYLVRNLIRSPKSWQE